MAEPRQDFVSLDYFISNSFLGKPAKEGYKGFLKLSRFFVSFQLPSKIGLFTDESDLTQIESFLTNNIETIEMPSVQIPSVPTPFRHQLNSRIEEGQVNALFFEDPIMSVRNVMWSWIDSISTKQGDSGPDNITREYFKNIAGKIRIYPLTLEGNMGRRYTELIDVFPTAVQGMNFNMANEQEVGKTAVTFKFRYHKIISI